MDGFSGFLFQSAHPYVGCDTPGSGLWVGSNIINLTAAKVLPNRNFSIAFKGNRALFTLFGVNFSSFDRLLRHSKGTVQILFFLEQHLIIYR